MRRAKNKFVQSYENIKPGNSEGPLLDKNGNVVSIAMSGLVVNNKTQGVNFFIPINDALSALNVVTN